MYFWFVKIFFFSWYWDPDRGFRRYGSGGQWRQNPDRQHKISCSFFDAFLDNAFLGKCVPRTKRPQDEASPYCTFLTGEGVGGICRAPGVTEVSASSWCWDYPPTAGMRSRVGLHDYISQGLVVQGTHRLRSFVLGGTNWSRKNYHGIFLS